MKVAHAGQFYIDGHWIEPLGRDRIAVFNPATEARLGEIVAGTAADVDRAVAAAKRAFPAYADLSMDKRIELLERLDAAYAEREPLLAEAMCLEIGAPISYSRAMQAALPRLHIASAIRAARSLEAGRRRGTSLVAREPIGVCALITPWNFPLNTLVPKVVPALLAGCTVVLKPSEMSPFSALLFAEAVDAAGFAPGAFNLVNGDGPTVGRALAAHPDVAMISITGSVAAGVDVARTAAPTVKRVHQELGGKSANVVLDDANLQACIPLSVAACFRNSGQSCSAPTRLLVPRSLRSQCEAIAFDTARGYIIGDPLAHETQLGPVVSRRQFERVQSLIEEAVASGARIVCGGPGRPDGIDTGWFVKPTILASVTPEMSVAQEEIFGPVLVIMEYDDEDEAVAIANGTRYGLAAYVQSADRDRARRIAARLRAGTVHINFPPYDTDVPFGGFKQSGNGREYGEWGLEEYFELKSITGYFGSEEPA